jgi:hypothetical protein
MEFFRSTEDQSSDEKGDKASYSPRQMN